jgi:hypothetical protein
MNDIKDSKNRSKQGQQSLVKSSTTDLDVAQGLSYKEKMDLFTELAKSASSGVTDAGQAMLVWQKAKELGIGWANAIPHMHIIRGKAGIDIHIIKAILSKPGSGVTWECIEDYKPMYRYSDGVNIYIGEDSLPPNGQVTKTLKEAVPEGKKAVVIVPDTIVKNGKTEYVIQPYDYRTKYIFKRTKRDITGDYIKVVTHKGVFSWRDALTAGLPYNKAGELDASSAWQAYRKLMVDIRAFTFGARDIASDLLMGCYETTELYDMSEVNYNVTEDGKTEVMND